MDKPETTRGVRSTLTPTDVRFVRRKSDGKLPLDRDLTHTGLHVHHSTPIYPSDTKSSWDSPSPDTTITCIHQQQPVQPEIDASLANQDQDQDHQETQKVSPQDIAEGMTISHREARMTESRKEGTRPDTRSTGRSVDWSDSIEDQPTEEAVLQISGVGHWFLEGWIGDHAVDFLVDSGSAVTVLSCKFYQTLLSAGAPVGVLRPTDRRLRGANGSSIEILG